MLSRPAESSCLEEEKEVVSRYVQARAQPMTGAG